MLYVVLAITISYLVLIITLIWGFDKTPMFYLEEHEPKISFSVVVPFRNEAKNLPALLKSIKILAYPKQLFEIIFVKINLYLYY